MFQAFDPLLLLHPLGSQGCFGVTASLTHSPSLSEGYQSQPLWIHSKDWDCSDFKILKLADKHVLAFSRVSSPDLYPSAVGCLSTFQIPVHTWLHLWVLREDCLQLQRQDTLNWQNESQPCSEPCVACRAVAEHTHPTSDERDVPAWWGRWGAERHQSSSA